MLNKTHDTITVKELSQILRLGINNAYFLVKSGTIFSVRVGRQYRIPRSALEKFLCEKEGSCD